MRPTARLPDFRHPTAPASRSTRSTPNTRTTPAAQERPPFPQEALAFVALHSGVAPLGVRAWQAVFAFEEPVAGVQEQLLVGRVELLAREDGSAADHHQPADLGVRFAGSVCLVSLSLPIAALTRQARCRQAAREWIQHGCRHLRVRESSPCVYLVSRTTRPALATRRPRRPGTGRGGLRRVCPSSDRRTAWPGSAAARPGPGHRRCCEPPLGFLHSTRLRARAGNPAGMDFLLLPVHLPRPGRRAADPASECRVAGRRLRLSPASRRRSGCSCRSRGFGGNVTGGMSVGAPPS